MKYLALSLSDVVFIMHYLCEDGIEKYVDHHLSLLSCPVMTNGDHEGHILLRG